MALHPIEPAPNAHFQSPHPRQRRPYARYATIGVVAVLALAVAANLSNGKDAAKAISPAATPARAETPSARAPQPTSAPATSAAAFGPTGRTTKAKVTRVVDGDTIVVAVGKKLYHVRYIGMDTPEDVKPNTPVEFMAREAAAANSRLVAGKSVILERDVSETDRFARLLRNVWVQRNGVLTLVGLELVRTGYAQVTTFPPDVKYVDELTAAERAARSAALGLWGPTS